MHNYHQGKSEDTKRTRSKINRITKDETNVIKQDRQKRQQQQRPQHHLQILQDGQMQSRQAVLVISLRRPSRHLPQSTRTKRPLYNRPRTRTPDRRSTWTPERQERKRTRTPERKCQRTRERTPDRRQDKNAPEHQSGNANEPPKWTPEFTQQKNTPEHRRGDDNNHKRWDKPDHHLGYSQGHQKGRHHYTTGKTHRTETTSNPEDTTEKEAAGHTPTTGTEAHPETERHATMMIGTAIGSDHEAKAS